MGYKVYKYVKGENGNNGHYVDENGNINNNIKGNNEFVVYDEDTKKFLDESHTRAYLESIGHDLVDEEIEHDEYENNNINNDLENQPKDNLENQPNNNQENNNQENNNQGNKSNKEEVLDQGNLELSLKTDFVFNLINDIKQEVTDERSIDIRALYSYYGFKKTSDMTKQAVSASTFKKSTTNYFIASSVGTYVGEANDISSYSVGDILASLGRKIAYYSTSKDKDTRRFQEDVEKKNRDDKMEELQNQYREQGLSDEEIETKLKANTLIYNNNSLEVSPYRRKEKLNEEPREIVDVDEELENYANLERALMAPLLGFGNPAGASEQFLDKEALKDGRYVYNEKAIIDFTKKAFASEKEKINTITSTMRFVDFEQANNDYQITFDDSNLNFNQVYYDGTQAYKAENKNVKVDDFTPVEIKETILNEEVNKITDKRLVDYNKSIYDKTNVYIKMKKIQENRSKWYSFWHPFESKKQKNLLEDIKQEISDSLLDNTKFKDNILGALNSSAKSKECIDFLTTSKNLINEPLDPEKKDVYRNFAKGKIQVANIPENFHKTVAKEMKDFVNNEKEKEKVIIEPVKVINKEKEEIIDDLQINKNK